MSHILYLAVIVNFITATINPVGQRVAGGPPVCVFSSLNGHPGHFGVLSQVKLYPLSLI